MQNVSATGFEPWFFEKSFDPVAAAKWYEESKILALEIIVMYVILIFGIQWFMKDKPRFELRSALVLWNSGLAVFSILAAVRTVPLVINYVINYGYSDSVCLGAAYTDPVTGYWLAAFCFSKFIELFDTLFIVLRKQKLIFLHWYHHALVLWGCWYYYNIHLGRAAWSVAMNASIHSLMYTYYALRAAKIYLPRRFNIMLTSLQILQMVIGTANNYIAYRRIQDPETSCGRDTMASVIAGTWTYFSFFILFCNFFYHAYLAKKPRAENGTKKST